MKALIIKIGRFFGKLYGPNLGGKTISLISKLTDAPILTIALQQYGIHKCCNMEITGELFVIEKIFYPNINENEILIDVGANMGKYSEILQSYFPNNRIIAIEPNQNAFSYLNSKYKFDCLNNAVGTIEGDRTFYISSENKTSAQASFAQEGIPSTEKPLAIIVSVKSLNNIIKEQNLQNIALLKVDAEGFDYDVLLSGHSQLKKVKFIQFEFNEKHVFSRTFLRDFYNLLSETHKLYRLDTDRIHDISQYQPTNEIFRFQNILAVNNSIKLNSDIKIVKS